MSSLNGLSGDDNFWLCYTDIELGLSRIGSLDLYALRLAFLRQKEILAPTSLRLYFSAKAMVFHLA